jgi:hypothetical protein
MHKGYSAMSKRKGKVGSISAQAATPSVRELALRAVCAALAVAGSPAVRVYRSQLDQIDQQQLPCFDVTPGEEKIDDPGEFGDRVSVTRTLSVTVRALVDAEDADDSVLDPFNVWVAQQLTGANATLGGAVNDCDEKGSTTVFQPNGRNIFGLEQQFELKFSTRRGDPTQKG